MYQLVSAIAKNLTGDGRWRNVDIGDVPLSTVFATYKSITAVLSNNFLTSNVSFDLEQLQVSMAASATTFNEFLVANANKTLVTSTTIPVINTRYAKYANAFHAGYNVTPIHPTAAPDAEILPADKTWVQLTRPNTDYAAFHKSCLVNINGFYHQTDFDTAGVYVIEGMKSVHLSGRNQIGIYSMAALGNLSFIPITPDMVYKQSSEQILAQNCYVDTGVDLSKSTVMLVLGGYLHVLDKKTFRRISPSAFVIDFKNLPLVQRFYESRNVIDLSTLDLETTDRNKSQVSIAQLFSDDVLTKYLTLTQSFFVVLDNNDIFLEKHILKNLSTPGVYETREQPIYPLVVGSGLHEPYWYRSEHGRFAICCKGNQRGKKLFETMDYHNARSVSKENILADGARNSDAEFLYIGTDI